MGCRNESFSERYGILWRLAYARLIVVDSPPVTWGSNIAKDMYVGELDISAYTSGKNRWYVM